MGIAERRERERQNRISMITEAARSTFQEKGYELANIEEIAEKAEVGVATIYQYFKGKRELYGSLSLHSIQRLADLIEEITKDKKSSILARFDRVWETISEVFRSDPLAVRIMYNFMHEENSEFLKAPFIQEQNALLQRTLSLIASLYEEGAQEGVFRKFKGVACADILLGSFVGVVIWEESKKKFNPRKDFLEPTLNTFLEIFKAGAVVSENGRETKAS